MGILIKECGEVQPHCDDCGVAICWSIDEIEYMEWKGFWDNWRCRDCNPSYKGAYEDYKSKNKPFGELIYKYLKSKQKMIKLQYFNGENWIEAGDFSSEKIAWISLGGDDVNYRTVDVNGNILTDKSI